ncbi:MAG: hypothetical protein Fur005_19790 [Roseiflexaceae bacterium]
MIREILLLHHTHTDIGYTHDQPIVWELNRQFIDDALEQIDLTAGWDADSRPIWTCEVIGTLLHWLRSASPAQIAHFRQAAAQGRMSGCAMPYNFTPMVGVPQFLRALAPLKELRAQLGLGFRVALNHDINGLPWTMIPLLIDAGIEMVIMGINVHFGGFPLHRPLFFRWIGPDGRSLIALNGEHYGMFQRYARLNEGSLEAMAEGIAAYQQKLATQHYPHDFAYLSLTHYDFWDNNPPYPAAYELIRQWNAQGRTPQIRFVTPEELLARAQTLDLPSYHGDWTDYWNFGAGSSAYENRLGHQARTALAAADLLALQPHPPRDRALPQLIEQAYHALTLWDEHTWGDWASIGHPDRETVQAGWYHKAHPAYQAASLARYALTEQLEGLAENPRHAKGADGMLVLNPTPFARREYVQIPRELAEGTYTHMSSTVHRQADATGLDPQRSVGVYGPIEVPAYGYVRLPRSEWRLEPAQGLHAQPGLLESPTHRISFDPHSGAIHSLIDRRSGREYVDRTSPWPLLSLIHETVVGAADTPSRGRELLLNLDYGQFQETSFVADWPAERTLEQVQQVQLIEQPDRIGLEVQCSLPGASEIVKRIWLASHTDRIEIDISLHKADQWQPDSIYLALPLDLPGWEATFDTMGTPTQLDREQIPGCCRDWVTVSGYAAVHTADAGLTLACPDSPLVMIGAFQFGQRQRQVERSGRPLLLAWLLNNYWNTNFRASQPGFMRFRYGVATHGAFEPWAAAQVAAHARAALACHPAITAEQHQVGQLFAIEGDGVILAAAQRQGDRVWLWLQNLTATPQQVRCSCPLLPVQQAFRCDTLGQQQEPLMLDQQAVVVPIAARSLAGVVCVLATSHP